IESIIAPPNEIFFSRAIMSYSILVARCSQARTQPGRACTPCAPAFGFSDDSPASRKFAQFADFKLLFLLLHRSTAWGENPLSNPTLARSRFRFPSHDRPQRSRPAATAPGMAAPACRRSLYL